MGPGSCSADERKRRTIEYRNGIQSSTISYSNVVDGITNKEYGYLENKILAQPNFIFYVILEINTDDFFQVQNHFAVYVRSNEPINICFGAATKFTYCMTAWALSEK